MSTLEQQPPGTQAERTVLAWTRTSLSLLAGIVAVARLAAEASLALAIVIAGAGAPLTVATMWTINRRHQHRHRQRVREADGRLPIMTAALATFVGLAGLLEILLR